MTDTLERLEQEQPAPKRRKRSRWRAMMFFVLLVSLGLVASGVLPIQQYLEREYQVTAAQERLATLEDANTTISSDVDALQSDQEIERVAREQYGFVRPGEIGYVVIVPDNPDAITQTLAPVDVETESPGFFERIWRYLTGDDIAADG
jgi:cell division protein FtsB